MKLFATLLGLVLVASTSFAGTGDTGSASIVISDKAGKVLLTSTLRKPVSIGYLFSGSACLETADKTNGRAVLERLVNKMVDQYNEDNRDGELSNSAGIYLPKEPSNGFYKLQVRFNVWDIEELRLKEVNKTVSIGICR